MPRYWDLIRALALAVALGMAVGIVGCGGGGDEGAAGTTAAQAPGAGTSSEDDSTEGDGGTLGPPGAPMMGSGGMPGMPPMGGMGSGMGMPGMAGGMGGEQPAAPAAAGPKVTTKPPNARPDPFAPWWNATPPPPPAITLVEPFRIATRESVVRPPEEPVQVEEVPNRRVAGIGTGEGVYALIEGPEGQTVVRPGDTLGDYRVEAIKARSVVLKRKVGNVTYTQEVPLTDVGSMARTGFVGGMRGAPGGAGMLFRGGAGGGGAGGPIGAETEM